jgi:hypothetical protein
VLSVLDALKVLSPLHMVTFSIRLNPLNTTSTLLGQFPRNNIKSADPIPRWHLISTSNRSFLSKIESSSFWREAKVVGKMSLYLALLDMVSGSAPAGDAPATKRTATKRTATKRLSLWSLANCGSSRPTASESRHFARTAMAVTGSAEVNIGRSTEESESESESEIEGSTSVFTI